MSNPALPANDPMRGNFVLAALDRGDGALTHWRGWPQGGWWNSPLLFWDDFSATANSPETPTRATTPAPSASNAPSPPAPPPLSPSSSPGISPTARPPGAAGKPPRATNTTSSATTTPPASPTPGPPPNTLAANLPRLEKQDAHLRRRPPRQHHPRRHQGSRHRQPLHPGLHHLLPHRRRRVPRLRRRQRQRRLLLRQLHPRLELRNRHRPPLPHSGPLPAQASFGYSMDDAGAIHFRQLPSRRHRALRFRRRRRHRWARSSTPISIGTSPATSSGSATSWPRIKKALEFAWVPGGWDGDRDGVLEGVQHNTYDVEFYGPNPQCGIYYLGALRAGEEMARAARRHRLRRRIPSPVRAAARQWIDANLFNGEFYIQTDSRCRHGQDRSLPAQRHGFAETPKHPNTRSATAVCSIS